MIEKSRLEELIKEGATIYEAKYGKVNPVDLAKQKVRLISEKMNMIDFEPSTEEKYLNHKYFHRLFETKKQAEWALKYQFITRTEELNLPMWEEFCELNKLVVNFEIEITDKNKVCHLLYKTGRYINIWDTNDKEVEFSIPATEENYTTACDLCVKLFKGEEV